MWYSIHSMTGRVVLTTVVVLLGSAVTLIYSLINQWS